MSAVKDGGWALMVRNEPAWNFALVLLLLGRLSRAQNYIPQHFSRDGETCNFHGDVSAERGEASYLCMSLRTLRDKNKNDKYKYNLM